MTRSIKKKRTKKYGRKKNNIKKTILDSINKENISSLVFTFFGLILAVIAVTTYQKAVNSFFGGNTVSIDLGLLQKGSFFVHDDHLYLMNMNNYDWNTRNTKNGPGIIMQINCEFQYIYPGKITKNKLYNIPLENFKKWDGKKFSTKYYSIDNFFICPDGDCAVFKDIPRIKPEDEKDIKTL